MILGAGLDSFASGAAWPRQGARVRGGPPGQPGGQAVGAGRRGDTVPGNVAYVPADLAVDSLHEGLAGAGFDAAAPALFGWLGVTMYLTADAVAATMAAVAGLAPGSELIADYMLPEGERDEAGALYGKLVAQASAEHGEPWRSYFTPAQIAALARRPGSARCAGSGSGTPFRRPVAARGLAAPGGACRPLPRRGRRS